MFDVTPYLMGMRTIDVIEAFGPLAGMHAAMDRAGAGMPCGFVVHFENRTPRELEAAIATIRSRFPVLNCGIEWIAARPCIGPVGGGRIRCRLPGNIVQFRGAGWFGAVAVPHHATWQRHLVVRRLGARRRRRAVYAALRRGDFRDPERQARPCPDGQSAETGSPPVDGQLVAALRGRAAFALYQHSAQGARHSLGRLDDDRSQRQRAHADGGAWRVRRVYRLAGGRRLPCLCRAAGGKGQGLGFTQPAYPLSRRKCRRAASASASARCCCRSNYRAHRTSPLSRAGFRRAGAK